MTGGEECLMLVVLGWTMMQTPLVEIIWMVFAVLCILDTLWNWWERIAAKRNKK